MEHGHHVYSDGVRVRVPGGGDGLVQPVRAELGAVGDDGSAVLSLRLWKRRSAGVGRRSSTAIKGRSLPVRKFTGVLKERDIYISMDGRGRSLSNIFVE